MSYHQLGIILKSFFPEKQTISLLSKLDGKIKLIILNGKKMQRLGPGTLISFYTESYTAHDVTILSMPQFNSLDDMYWLHHLLELCYYFISLHEDCLQQFILIHVCQQLIDIPKSPLNKKLITGLLLTTLGFYPPQSLLFLYNLKKILSSCIDFDLNKKIEFLVQHLEELNEKQLQDLDLWILECINSHPRREVFKTIKFIYKPA